MTLTDACCMRDCFRDVYSKARRESIDDMMHLLLLLVVQQVALSSSA